MNWISVKERLPDQKEEILFIQKRNGFYAGYYIGELFEARTSGCGCCDESFKIEDVTHWMPVPNPPEETK